MRSAVIASELLLVAKDRKAAALDLSFAELNVLLGYRRQIWSCVWQSGLKIFQMYCQCLQPSPCCRQPINRPLEPTAAAPPGSWPAMAAGTHSQPATCLEQPEEGPHVMTWSRVVNPEAPRKQPPPTVQVCSLLVDLLLPCWDVLPDALSGPIVAWDSSSSKAHGLIFCNARSSHQ